MDSLAHVANQLCMGVKQRLLTVIKRCFSSLIISLTKPLFSAMEDAQCWTLISNVIKDHICALLTRGTNARSR